MSDHPERLICERCGWPIAPDDDQLCQICWATLCGHCGQPNVNGDPICAPIWHGHTEQCALYTVEDETATCDCQRVATALLSPDSSHD